MLIEIGIMLYFLIGICIYITYKEDIKHHANENTVSAYIRRILYIVTFIVTIFLWPLLVGI